MVTNGTILDRVSKLARDIAADYQGEIIHLLCVLKVPSTLYCDASGAHQFFSELVRELELLGVPICYDFVKAKSYDGTASSGKGGSGGGG